MGQLPAYDQAGINRKPFRTNQSFGRAAYHCRLEHVSKDVALLEPAIAVLREARVIGDLAVQTEAAEPAIGEIEVDLLAQSALRADNHGVADE